MVIDGSVVTDRHNIRVTAAGGAMVVENRQARLDHLTGEFDLGDDDVRIANAEVEVERSRLALTGSIVGFDATQADLTVQGRVDVSRASTLAGLKEAVGGPLPSTRP